MRQRYRTWFTVCLVALLGANCAWAVTRGEVDDFEDGTPEGWTEGVSSPNQPINIADGGPSGAGDNYLENTAAGGFGAGSRLAMFNRNQWAGDYSGIGFAVVIAMQVKNFSPNSLPFRVGIQGSSGDRWVTSDPSAVFVDGGSEWVFAEFSLSEANMVQVFGTNAFPTTLGDVTELRIFSSATEKWQGDAIAATFGVDNIEIALFADGFESGDTTAWSAK